MNIEIFIINKFEILFSHNTNYLADAFIQKWLTNEDSRSNQNQQKSNNM